MAHGWKNLLRPESPHCCPYTVLSLTVLQKHLRSKGKYRKCSIYRKNEGTLFHTYTCTAIKVFDKKSTVPCIAMHLH